jgi:hypothetical protein
LIAPLVESYAPRRSRRSRHRPGEGVGEFSRNHSHV